MSKFLPVFKFVIALIFELEQAIPQSGQGQTKKQIILNAVDLGAKAAEGLATVNPLAGVISALIDTTVEHLNTAGVFGKNPAPPPQ